MKIVLNYDPVTGQISNKDGGFITSWMGLELHELQEGEVTHISHLTLLKAAGFTASDIVELKGGGLL